jgi:hypothetical protein
MDIAEELIKGVLLLKDTSKFNNAVFQEIVNLSFEILAGREKTEEDFLESKVLANIDKTVLKQIYAGLVTVILEAAKRKLDSIQFKEYLEGYKFPQERVDFICQRYAEKFNVLRTNLSQSQFQFPHIVDVQWRLDYFIKSNAVEKINQPVYLIKLRTKQSPAGESKDFEFACTLEQMQDLVAKLKDAEHTLERQDFS